MKPIKKLLILYLIIVLVKIILVYLIDIPTAFSDNHAYIKLARSFFNSFTFTIYEKPFFHYEPLYIILISPLYLLKDMNLIYLGIKVVNSIISTLAIFPAYLLLKEFLTKKKAFLSTILISILPVNFSFSPYIMTENLLYPLFLLSAYFIYKSFTTKKIKYELLAGFSLALAYLTKITAIILLIATLLISLYLKLKNKESIKNKIFFIISFLIPIITWSLVKSFHKTSAIDERYGIEFIRFLNINPLIFLNWIILHIGLLTLSLAIILFITNYFFIKEMKNKKYFILGSLTYLSTILIILIASNHNMIYARNEFFTWLIGRPLGRYIDLVLPLTTITGIIGLNLYQKNQIKIPVFITSIILLISSQLYIFPLIPINNVSVAEIGAINYLISYILTREFTNYISFNLIIALTTLSLLILFSLLYFKNKINFKLIYPLLLFFLIVSLLNFSITFYNSKQWSNNEQMQLGKWINANIKEEATFLIDERDQGVITKDSIKVYEDLKQYGKASIIGFWINNKIIISNVENLKDINYIISNHKLNLPIIKSTENIYLYKVEK